MDLTLTKIIKRNTTFTIDNCPVKSIYIGDPFYEEEKDLTFNAKVPKQFAAEAIYGTEKRIDQSGYSAIVSLKEVEDVFNGVTFGHITAAVVIFPSFMSKPGPWTPLYHNLVTTYLQGRYMPAATTRHIELGCDTACFEICTTHHDKKQPIVCTFNTGADGFYGFALKYKKSAGDGLAFDFTVSGDCMSFEEVEAQLRTLLS
jgi:hypothetical protein